MRVGFGVDVHRFGGPGPMRLGGVIVDTERGIEATSDGDVAVHAVIDAVFGAVALGDIGSHFPSTDEQWHGVSSLEMLSIALQRVGSLGFRVRSIDVTVVAQSLRVDPHRSAMRVTLAEVLGVDVSSVSVKATTTDTMGFIGSGEGIAAMAVVMVEPTVGEAG